MGKEIGQTLKRYLCEIVYHIFTINSAIRRLAIALKHVETPTDIRNAETFQWIIELVSLCTETNLSRS